MKKGTILFHKNFPFKDGDSSPKLLVVLNSPTIQDPFLAVRTTSQQKHRPRQSGCIEGKNLFFIEAGKTSFPIDTWIQLYDFYEISHERFMMEFLSGRLDIKGDLPEQMVNALINCAKRSDDISEYQLSLISKKKN